MTDRKTRIKGLVSRYLPSLLMISALLILLIMRKYLGLLIVPSAVLICELFAFMVFFKGELKISTPDGYNQPYHPSVIFFERGWKGHRYWMAFTPFPRGAEPYRDRWENPCVIASDNAIDWEYPDGKKRFLEDLSEEQIANRNYFSDTHLIFNSDREELELFFRLNEGENCESICIFRKCSSNGVDWSEKELLTSCDELYGLKPVSPAVIYRDGEYRMWFVADEGAKGPVYTVQSNDGIHWDNTGRCSLQGYKVNPWHIDCKIIDNAYCMLIYDQNGELTLWKSDDGNSFEFSSLLLTPCKRTGLFYNSSLYRSSAVKTDSGIKVFFSAGNDRKVGIGLAEINEDGKLKVISASEKSKEDYLTFFGEFFKKYTAIIRRLLN